MTENLQEAKNLIIGSKNIYIIPQEEPEAFVCSLALFYTLKELNKNVNLVIDELPESIKFLAPSLDFVSYPKNFVISIPNKIANISQIYYEKNDNDLKIHLTLDKGIIKKDEVSFYFSETKPDLIITLGVKDYHAQMKNKMDSFGFLLDSPILNIDSGQTNNENFGKINLISSQLITETTTQIVKGISGNPIKKESAESLLTGLIICTDNFKNSKVTADIFELAGSLMKQGASLQKINENLKT